MNNEKNLLFMNNPKRVSAKKELDKIVQHIQTDISWEGNAHYYLTVLPPLLNQLEKAYDNLTAIETALIAELEGQKNA